MVSSGKTLPDSSRRDSGRSRDTANRRILLVEDNDDVREMIRLYLESFGIEVSEAADGPSGLTTALRERPDLVLMDLGLPGMDGFSLARAIREGDPQGNIRIVAMSGYGEEQVAHRMQPGLIDRWLLKPIAPDVLLKVIEDS